MSSFKVDIFIRIITSSSSDDSGFLVLLDDDGEFPSFAMSNQMSLDQQISEKLNSYIYDNDINIVLSTKMISSIENKNDILEIWYTFLSSNTYSKKGSFVSFNKNSIELYRLANSNI